MHVSDVMHSVAEHSFYALELVLQYPAVTQQSPQSSCVIHWHTQVMRADIDVCTFKVKQTVS